MNVSVDIKTTSGTALLTSIAILITDDYISKSKTLSNNLRDWRNVFSLLFQKTFKQLMID